MRATLAFVLALCVRCGGSPPVTDPDPDPTAVTKHLELFTGVRWSGNISQNFSCNGSPASNRASTVSFTLAASNDPAHDLEYATADGCVFRFDLNPSKSGDQAVATLGNAPVTCVGHTADGTRVQEEADVYRIATSDGKTLSFHAISKSATPSASCVLTDDGVLASSPIPVGAKHPELFVGTWRGTVAINAVCNGVAVQGSSPFGFTIRESSVPGHDLEYLDGIGCLFRWDLTSIVAGQEEVATLGNGQVRCVERSANDVVDWSYGGFTLRATDATSLTVHASLTTVETTQARTTTCVTTWDGTATH